jgi:hypothetical protein
MQHVRPDDPPFGRHLGSQTEPSTVTAKSISKNENQTTYRQDTNRSEHLPMETLIHGVGNPATLHVPLHLRVSDQVSVSHQDGPRPHGL